MYKDIHPIQANILIVLLFNSQARYTDLNTTKIETDHFNFHIKRLIELELIEKTSSGKYQLTTIGKEFANRFDEENAKLERQPKPTVMVICLRECRNKTQVLIQKRLKEPYFGFHGVISGKIRWGETILESAQRELYEETGLKGSLTICAVEHKMDYQDDVLVEDKIFMVVRATDIKGRLQAKFKAGENIWMDLEKVKGLPNLFDDMHKVLGAATKNKLVFLEDKYHITGF